MPLVYFNNHSIPTVVDFDTMTTTFSSRNGNKTYKLKRHGKNRWSNSASVNGSKTHIRWLDISEANSKILEKAYSDWIADTLLLGVDDK